MTTESRQLRVAVSMLTLVPGGMGGSETYARELIRSLARSTVVEATGFVTQFGAGFCEGIAEVVAPHVAGGASTVDRTRTLLQAAFLRRRSLQDAMGGFDVVHVPFTAPVPPPRRGTPLVQTLLDVQHLDLPHLFSRVTRLYRRHYYDGAARRATAVITISEFAKKQIVTHLGLDPERVFVAPLGVDVAAFTPNLGERERFVYYPARGWPHKNHVRLFEAVALLRETHPDLRLVLTGGALDSLGTVPEWVDVRGLVPFSEVGRLYRTASALSSRASMKGSVCPRSRRWPPAARWLPRRPAPSPRSAAMPRSCSTRPIPRPSHAPPPRRSLDARSSSPSVWPASPTSPGMPVCGCTSRPTRSPQRDTGNE